jgi:hypothetical protein
MRPPSHVLADKLKVARRVTTTSHNKIKKKSVHTAGHTVLRKIPSKSPPELSESYRRLDT